MNIYNIINMGDGFTDSERAADAWARIQDKPEIVTLVREKTSLDPQTVRIEWSNTVSSGTQEAGAGGMSAYRYGILFGIHGHDSLPDTDVRRSDRFALNGYQYKIISVMKTIGEYQASFEALG